MRMTFHRLGLVAVLFAGFLGCGGGKQAAAPRAAPAAGPYAATRWIPARPSYAVGARTFRDAQRGLRDLVESFGPLVDLDADDISQGLRAVLRVDALSADAVAAIGVDLDGGFAVFSEGINPTVVVRLASAAQFQTFIEQQQQAGLRTQSVVSAGVEVFTAPLPNQVSISWAIADDWLWLHIGLPFAADDAATWFAASRRPGAPTWTADWQAAQGSAQPAVVGFADVRRIVGELGPRAPAAAACARLLDPVSKLTLALDGDAKQMSARFAFDVGPAAASITQATLAVPEGWAAATAQVPIAAAWNLDLAVVRTTVAPCTTALGIDLLRRFEDLGVRGGRAFLRSFDPDERSGSGVASLELAHKRYFAAQLDDIPMRSVLERKRQFGPYAGKALAIPMFMTIDYVLTDAVAFAAVGDGMLASVVGKGGTVPGPVVALAVHPLGLSREAWIGLFDLLDVPQPDRVADHLLRWREARLAVTVDGARLVVAASGTRR